MRITQALGVWAYALAWIRNNLKNIVHVVSCQ